MQATPPPTSQPDGCPHCGNRLAHIEYLIWIDGHLERVEPGTLEGISVDQRSLTELEDVLGELEQLHDLDETSRRLRSGRVRACLCSAASAWRRGRQVTDSLRAGLGLRARLI